MLEMGFPEYLSLPSTEESGINGPHSEELRTLRAIFDASGTSMAFFDRKLHIVTANLQMRRYLGLASSTSLDRPLPEILGADRFGRFEGRIMACLNGEAQDFQEGAAGPGKGIHARFVPARNADGEVLGFVALLGEEGGSEDLEKTLAVREEALLAREIEFRRQSTTDSLSGTLTRSAILQLLEEEIRRASRYGRPFALVLFDLDHFKLVNDIHGRAAGDEAIRRFASICRTCFRTTDYLGRYGGEEFLGILPEVDGEGGLLAADRVRSALQAERFRLPRPLGAKNIEDEFTVTVSAGIAGFEKGYDSDTMLAATDKALYKAKDQGRNRVVLHGRH